jgi:hypothetical protein
MKIVLKFAGFIWAIAFFSFFVLSFYAGTGGEIPPIAKEFIGVFHYLIEAFLTSHWFFVFFIVGWFGVSYTLGKESGWQYLAKRYENDKQKNQDLKFHTGNGYVGKIRHSGILRVAADKEGIYLRVLFPFKFGHKNLFIPWDDISAITLESGLFSDKTPSLFKNIGKFLSKTEYLNVKLQQFPDQRLTIQNFAQLSGLMPKHIKI